MRGFSFVAADGFRELPKGAGTDERGEAVSVRPMQVPIAVIPAFAGM